MKYFVLALLLGLTACGGDRDLLVVRTRAEIMLPPPEITGNCPTEIDLIVPTGVQGRYTESETGEISKRNRVAYVDCRTVVQQIIDYYADQKARADKLNPKP